MPQLNHIGPENKEARSGRKLGKCKSQEKSDFAMGEGMSLKK